MIYEGDHPKREGEDELEEFFGVVRRIFRSNAHKGTWKHLTDDNLFRKLEEERSELRIELQRPTVDPERVDEEAGDVANVAFLIARRDHARKPKEGGGGRWTAR